MLEGKGEELWWKVKSNRFVFKGGHWKLAYAEETLTSTRITKL